MDDTNQDISYFQESERVVTKKEGIDFARESGCLFLECSAKTRVNVEQCFEELVLKVNELISFCIVFHSQVESYLKNMPYYMLCFAFFLCFFFFFWNINLDQQKHLAVQKIYSDMRQIHPQNTTTKNEQKRQGT